MRPRSRRSAKRDPPPASPRNRLFVDAATGTGCWLLDRDDEIIVETEEVRQEAGGKPRGASLATVVLGKPAADGLERPAAVLHGAAAARRGRWLGDAAGAAGLECALSGLGPNEGMQGMPELARFFGIIVRMFVEPAGPHHRPHFHVYYQDDVCIIAIDTIEPIAGSLPRKQLRLVEAWAEIHQRELLEDWDRLQAGRPPLKIEPLR